ncbi:protein borderless [Bacillus rossius redtenbacheri]|uniref:protein borderless n=1 Tax=Bacillus rossius redtenbacheri TaxID=93214 RepID=UPI002FDC8780
MSSPLVSVLVLWITGMMGVTSFSLGLDEDKPPSYVQARVGEHAIFDCELDFPPYIPYVLRWNKEGRTVFWADREDEPRAVDEYRDRISLVPSSSPYGRGSVNLTSIRESDSGWYECSVYFPNRTPSTRANGTWFHLSVDGGTLLAIPPVNQTTLEGETAHFSCVTKDRDGMVTWYKDAAPLAEVVGLIERTHVGPEGSLTIHNTSMDDLGEYQCVVTNNAGERQTAAAFLNVQYKAKALPGPAEVYLPHGRPGVLECNFRANPPLLRLRWEKDGFLYDPYNVQGVFYSRNGSLYFKQVEESHAGVYTCTPINELGTDGPSRPIRVIVQRAPIFTLVPHNLYLKKIGDTLELPCDATDGAKEHRPSIVWFRDGHPLPLDRIVMQNGNLTLERVRQSDSGMYQCVASNEVATITADTELVVETKSPRAPHNLTASATASSIALRWMPGTGRASMDYNIWYRPADTPEWRTMKILTRGATQATIGNLDPGRLYELMVLSQDQHGDGMFSKAVQIRTASDGSDSDSAAQRVRRPLGSFQQIGPPRNVSVSPAKEGYLVTWEPPEFGQDELRGYAVHWSQEGREHLQGHKEVSGNRYLVTSLAEDTTYHFQVTAHSTRGYQAASSQYVLHVPGYRGIRAVALGVLAALALLVMAVGAALYLRRRYLRRLQRREKEDSSS